MPNQGENEGIKVLDDFVCEAICPPNLGEGKQTADTRQDCQGTPEHPVIQVPGQTKMDVTSFRTYRGLLAERPFRPFRIVMSSGEFFDVHDPKLVMLTQADIIVGVGGIEAGVPDECRICALGSVAEIQLSNSPASKSPT
jgi:hypothetical protein